MSKKETKHINLQEIKDPKFLGELTYKELDVLSEDISKYIIDVTSKNGGHLSSNLGVIDATIALCRVFDFSKDKIVFDVGHQCYTYKILTGRSLERLRQKDGVSGFQRMSESGYDHFESGHSSTSISVISGMAIARDLKKEKYDTIAFIGDASIANGLAFEGINVSSVNNHKMIIVLNDNDMSISKPVGAIARMFRKFSTSNLYRKSKKAYRKIMNLTWIGRKIYAFTALIKNWFKRHVIKINIFDAIGGYSFIGPVDGHNIKALEKAFKRSQRTDKSTIVMIKTIKGKGYKYAEDDEKGEWHGVGKFDVETGDSVPSSRIYWSTVYSDFIYNKIKEDEKSVLIVPATELGSNLNQTFKDFPEQCIDVGIAEEHAVTMAAGLAANGIHPIISIYSTFMQRAYDQTIHDVVRTHQAVTFIIDRSGLVGNDGSTHQGIFDESFLLGMPDNVIAMPSNIKQAKCIFEESFKHQLPFFIRCPREKIFIDKTNNEVVGFGKWKKIYDGNEIAIVSIGPETEILKDLIKGKGVALYNAIYLRPMDEGCINELLKYKKVIIYDAYGVESGFAYHLNAKLTKLGYKGDIIIKAVPNEFIHHSSLLEQKTDLGLLPEQIVELIK